MNDNKRKDTDKSDTGRIRELHKDLSDQYNRYWLGGVGLVLTAFLPIVTLASLYISGPGLSYLGNHMTSTVVAFTLGIPLVIALAYKLSYQKMKYLKRVSALIAKEEAEQNEIYGVYKKEINGRCCFEIESSKTADLEKLFFIASQGLEALSTSLSVEDSREREGPIAVQAYIDPQSKQPIALIYKEHLLWISPPDNPIDTKIN